MTMAIEMNGQRTEKIIQIKKFIRTIDNIIGL